MNRSAAVVAVVLVAVLAAAPSARAAPTCTRAAAKAAILANTHLKPVWPTLKSGGGVDRVYCRDLTRDGKPDMTATIYSGGTAGDIAWFVFRRVGAKLRTARSGHQPNSLAQGLRQSWYQTRDGDAGDKRYDEK